MGVDVGLFEVRYVGYEFVLFVDEVVAVGGAVRFGRVLWLWMLCFV